MMSAGTGDGVKKTLFGTLVEGAAVTSDFQVHLWNLRREKAIHLIGPENETEQEQAVRMEKVVALEASFIDHKARYKDAIVGAINFAKSCKETNDEQFPNYNTPRYIGYLSGLKLQLAQMDPFNAESYEDEVEIPPPRKYYRQKSPSDISRFWDQLWTQDNCISFYLPFARTAAIDQMRRETGSTSAAIVTSHLRSTFRSIRFFLLVGIGSGVPSVEYDVRLGDVGGNNCEKCSKDQLVPRALRDSRDPVVH